MFPLKLQLFIHFFNWIRSSTSQCFVTSNSKGAFVAILQKQSFAKINVMRFANIAWSLYYKFITYMPLLPKQMRKNIRDMKLVLLNIWKWVKFDKCLTMAFLIKMFSKRIDVTKIFCFSGSDKNIHRKMFSGLCHNKFHNFLGRNAKEFVVTNHSDRNDIEAWIPYTDTISIIGAIASW